MTRSRMLAVLLPLLTAALLAALVTTGPRAVHAAEPAATPAPPTLPGPTGAHPVSTRTVSYVDRGRRDPWAGGPRHVVVTMTYPAAASDDPAPARSMTPRESRALFTFQADRGYPLPDGVPPGILARTDVGASAGAPVARRPGGRPLVLLSPGFSLVRSSLTSLATDLASRGYVVAQVSHAHEDSGTELPSGRLLRCAACDVEDYATIPPVRVRDLSSVLDRLLAPTSGWRTVVDPGRVAAVGHSIGGNAAVSLAAADERVDAAVNLDGTFFDPVRRGLATPVMLLGARDSHRPRGEDETWLAAWRRLAGPRSWFTVDGGTHGSFTDNPLLIEQLTGQREEVRGGRAIELTRAYVGAFLDRHLRGRDAPLLDGADPEYPETARHRP